MTSPITAVAMDRMNRALGPRDAARYAQDAFTRLGRSELDTADELLRFAEVILAMSAGNFVLESVGRALKVTAILRGAREVA